jgi:hypothetical protein
VSGTPTTNNSNPIELYECTPNNSQGMVHSQLTENANGTAQAPMRNNVQSPVEHFGAASNVNDLVGNDVELNARGKPQCVALVQQEAGAPRVSVGWYQGTQLTPESIKSIPAGTPIGSGFKPDGTFPMNSTGQHAGLLGAVTDKGFYIVEQYVGIKDTEIQSRFIPWSTTKKDYFHNPYAYSTIKW